MARLVFALLAHTGTQLPSSCVTGRSHPLAHAVSLFIAKNYLSELGCIDKKIKVGW